MIFHVNLLARYSIAVTQLTALWYGKGVMGKFQIFMNGHNAKFGTKQRGFYRLGKDRKGGAKPSLKAIAPMWAVGATPDDLCAQYFVPSHFRKFHTRCYAILLGTDRERRTDFVVWLAA